MNFNLMVVIAIVYSIQNGADGVTSLAAGNLPAKDEVIVPKTCTMERVYRKVGYDCTNMNLREIPQYLRTSVEVFDVSFNRIRELNKKSFARYSDLKYLYLFDNMIQHIEKDTFAHLTSLEAIDLSINGLSTIPLELFQLPRLRNLYINDNSLVHLTADLKNLEKPIAAPLQKLSIVNCKLSAIPNFGILPDLLLLNISFNLFDQITPQQFSPFCSLTAVAIENSTDISPCTCKSLKIYFERRGISLKDSFDCPTIKEELVYCSDGMNSTIDSDEYHICMERVTDKKMAEESKRTWLWIVFALGAFFFCFICTLYYFHRRNVNKAKTEEIKMTKLRHIHQTENGNREVLLNGKV